MKVMAITLKYFFVCRFEKMDSIVEVEAKQQEMERKHRKARSAWKHLADNLGKDDVRKFLEIRCPL